MKKSLKGEPMVESARFISIIFFLSFIGHIGGTIYMAVLPELGQFFHVSSSFIKFSITIYFMGLVLGTILSGLLAEAFGRFKTINFFLLLSIGGCLICIFSSDFSSDFTSSLECSSIRKPWNTESIPAVFFNQNIQGSCKLSEKIPQTHFREV